MSHESAVAAATQSAALLSIDGLDVSIGGKPVVRKLSLQVEAGEILGLVGASGSGKSMTALAILRLLPESAVMSGDIFLRGVALSGLKERELQAVRGRDVGLVFQEPLTALNPLMSIGAQVAETVHLHRGASRVGARQLARAALDAVGLTGPQGALDRYPHELSGGQRQRVAIAIAAVLEPKLLIADEPTTALDVNTQAQVLAVLQGLARTRGMGLILISHDLAVIAEFTDRIAVMHDGTIVEAGDTQQVLRERRHPHTQALFAAARLPRRTRVARAVAPVDVVLEVRELVREYPQRRRSVWRTAPSLRAVDRVSLTVRAGETVGLVGESGSGKSSVLRSVLALDRPQSGSVRLLGEEFSDAHGPSLRRLRRSIQGVFQDPYGSFDPQWTVARLIAEPFYLLDAAPPVAERRRRIDEVLLEVGLASRDADRHPHEFSGGQRQRIAIARALITAPAVIVLDEAVSALDVLVRTQILDVLADLSDRLRVAYLFVSHDLLVIRAIADRVYVMQHGRIVEEGDTETVFATPRHPYTQALLAATPSLSA